MESQDLQVVPVTAKQDPLGAPHHISTLPQVDQEMRCQQIQRMRRSELDLPAPQGLPLALADISWEPIKVVALSCDLSQSETMLSMGPKLCLTSRIME